MKGDQRVNWLLARSHAEEIRDGDHDRYDGDNVRPLAGRSWIEQSLQTAETPAVKKRVAKELAARLTAEGYFAEAREVLDRNGGKSAAAVVWRAEIDAFEVADVIESKSSASQEQLAQITRLRDRSSARGDKAAVVRYDALIRQLGGE